MLYSYRKDADYWDEVTQEIAVMCGECEESVKYIVGYDPRHTWIHI